MAPLVKGFIEHNHVESLLCVTGQHRHMLDQVLDIHNLKPDYDLDIMKEGQSLTHITSRILIGLETVLTKLNPDWVFVHGDTATTAAASMASYYQSIPVAHVEAGLRTNNIYSPWPEEINRRIAGVIASCHFAPTEKAKVNLLTEGVKEHNIHVCGNTVIDALFQGLKQLKMNKRLRESIDVNLPMLTSGKKLIVVTGHRRESFGEGFENITSALLTISKRNDVEIIYPVHLNPYVKKIVEAKLSGQDNIHLIEPLSYLAFIHLMSKAHIIITDSGGIQEEAPSLGIPVLVTRETTERPEALEVGATRLVGQSQVEIVAQTERLLDDHFLYQTMSETENPYGDGNAVGKIISHIMSH